MRRFYALAVAACLAAASLSSCTPAETTKLENGVIKVNTVVQAKLNDYCPKLEAAHQAFKIATFFISVPGAITDAESAAYVAAEVFCESPASVTVSTAPAKVLDAVDKINQVKADATSS